MNLRGTIFICLLLAMLMVTACGQSETTTSGEEPSAVEEVTAVAVAEATETSHELRRIIEAFEQDARIYPREFVDIGTLSPELRERLKSLGYVH